MEYCSGGNCGDLLKRQYKRKKRNFKEHELKLLFAEVLLAIENLHSNKVIYRDLKSHNVVLDHQGHAKLTDFGLSKVGVTMTTKTYSFCGSIKYLAPEMLAR